MARVYLETSFVSACVTTRADLASAYRRRVSREWWDLQRERHELFVSQEVLEELSSPRYPQRADALEWIAPLNVLQITPGVRELASTLVRERVMPGPVTGDAVHIATAVVYEMEYVLSWNVRHLANPNKLVHLQTVCARHAFTAPRIVTPDHVWENP